MFHCLRWSLCQLSSRHSIWKQRYLFCQPATFCNSISQTSHQISISTPVSLSARLNSLQLKCWKLNQSVTGAKMVALIRVAPCRRNAFGLPEHAVWCQISFAIPSKYIQHSHIDTIGLYCTNAANMLPQDIWQKCVRLFCVCSLSSSDKKVLLEKVLLECQRLQYGRCTSGRWRQPWEAGRQRWRWMSLITQMQCFE